MGTTLTGTTPQDTYDSLIKVTDNGPLSATAKYLSDGLGNDSALAVSTAAVGIGTSSPNAPLEVQADSGGTSIRVKGRSAANSGTIRFFNNASSTQLAKIESSDNSFEIGSVNNVYAAFLTNGTEQMRITSAGNVGIGTSSPSQKLTVYRNDAGNVSALIENAFINQGNLIQFNQNTTSGTVTALIGHGGDATGDLTFFNGGSKQVSITSAGVLSLTQGQIKFPATQVASADPNTLDDYEEGTWTPSLGGNTTYSAQAGTYTKIGRQVTVNFAVGVTTLGTGSGAVISSLPFTAGNINRGGGGIAFVQNPSTAYASINPFVGVSQNTVEFVTSTTSGVYNNASTVFTDGSIISGTVTYFV